jgi:DNA-binding transcriptional LysR family regulator
MDRFEAMRTLVTAADEGSLSAAARAMATPLPTVSRRVSDLEAQLGAQLLIRTSRRLVLTEAGEAYVGAARRLLADLSEAERIAAGEYRAPRGELVVTAPTMFGKLYVAPLVQDFLRAYPEVSVRLVLADHLLEFVEHQLDVAVRIGRLPDSELLASRVGEAKWIVCASPGYLAQRGEPQVPADLVHHACITLSALPDPTAWTFGAGASQQVVRVRTRLAVNSADVVIAAAEDGIGLARVMSYQAAAAIRADRLVPVLRAFSPEAVPVHVLHPSQKVQPLKRRAFIDFVTPRLRQALSALVATVESR